jgi:hypothetical protein
VKVQEGADFIADIAKHCGAEVLNIHHYERDEKEDRVTFTEHQWGKFLVMLSQHIKDSAIAKR